MKKWSVRTTDEDAALRLSQKTGLSVFMCRLLVMRGVDDEEKAKAFFGSEEISDPFLLADMDKAVDTIHQALDNNDKICVYGDYDCDGVTSTVILYNYLLAMGGDVSWYIPTRNEGYGLNNAAIDKIFSDGVRLIITVDNGISAREEADYITAKGMQLVITDHHQPPEQLPNASAIVNPKRRDDTSSCRVLAGVGVTLKLIMALDGDIDGIMEQYGDLAAIGTVGDIVPLTGENRVIVRRGLETIQTTDNIGLTKLVSQTKLSIDELTATSLAFSICPRINAAGRGATADIAAELFLCEDSATANAKALELCSLNTARRDTEETIISAIKQTIKNDRSLLNERVLIFSGENFNHGVIGIVSSRLLSEFGKPNMVISVEGEIAKGSARSVDNFSLYDLLDSVKDLLIRFGGHTKAAGFSLKTADIPEFTRRINASAAKLFPQPAAEIIYADGEIKPEDITVENCGLLNYLQPFGEENPVPVFLMKNCRIESKKSLKDGKYISFEVGYGKKRLRVLDFGHRFAEFGYNIGDSADVLVTIEANEYNGVSSVVLKLRDMRASGIVQDKYFAAKDAYEKIVRNEFVNPALLRRILPEKREMKIVYDLMRRTEVYSVLEESAVNAGVNYCMFRVILDVMEEYRLVEMDFADNRIKLIPSKEKADIDNSVHLKKLREQIEKGDSR